MKQNLNNQNLEQPEQTEQLPEIQPEQMQPEQPAEELSLSDGQTITTPLQAPEEIASDPLSSNSYLPTTKDFYEQGEFRAAFNEFLNFLHDPKAPGDSLELLAAKGQGLAADKIYNIASKYKWLNWLIDRKTEFFKDTMLISIFAVQEADLIGRNWFNVSIKEKAKTWLENQAKQRIKSALKPSGWGFLGRLGAAKRQKQES